MKDAFFPRWFTTDDFAGLEKISYLCKERDRRENASVLSNYHVLARAGFHYSGSGRVFVRVTADDYYILYINGIHVSRGPAPSHHTHRYYDEIEVTRYLHTGNNIFAAHLYYQGLVNRVWESGDNRFGIGTEIENIDSGEVTQPFWKYKKTEAFYGRVVGYGTDFSENFDSRLWESGWNTDEYDDSDWKNMVEEDHDYSFIRNPARPVGVYYMKPENIRYSRGTYFIDVGREVVGSLRITANGKSGQNVFIRFAEELNEDGTVRYDLRANCRYEEKWTLSDGENIFENYTYKGFRYAEIKSSDAEIMSVDVMCRHYPFDDGCVEIDTSDEKLNMVFALCRDTIKYATQESFIDCPTREKGQYLGDAFIAAHSHVLLTGNTDMLEKAAYDFAVTADICNGLMAVSSCSFMQEIADYSLIFGEMVLLAYEMNGKKEFLCKYYDYVKGVVLHFRKYERQDGMLSFVDDKWNLVDWPENMRDGYDFELLNPIRSHDVHNVINAYYVGALKTLVRIEKILGKNVSFDTEPYEKAYVKAFMRENGLFADSEKSGHFSLHSNVFALYFGLVPDKFERAVADYIIQRGMCCGVYVSYFLLKALSRAGRTMEVYNLLVNEGEHGWLNMIREGATTCFEAWGKGQKHNTSLCHPWATAPIPVIIEDLHIPVKRKNII